MMRDLGVGAYSRLSNGDPNTYRSSISAVATATDSTKDQKDAEQFPKKQHLHWSSRLSLVRGGQVEPTFCEWSHDEHL